MLSKIKHCGVVNPLGALQSRTCFNRYYVWSHAFTCSSEDKIARHLWIMDPKASDTIEISVFELLVTWPYCLCKVEDMLLFDIYIYITNFISKVFVIKHVHSWTKLIWFYHHLTHFLCPNNWVKDLPKATLFCLFG